MNNNDVLRRLRYIFDLADNKIVKIFTLVGAKVSREEVTSWLKKDEDPLLVECPDEQLATFLNGFIVERRGKKEGALPIPEQELNNNLVLRKLKIAMDFKSDDMLSTLKLAGISISEHELSAFFRKAEHRQHRYCKDQVLRNFLEGLRLTHRPS